MTHYGTAGYKEVKETEKCKRLW